MKELITLYVLRYGPADTLREVAAGLSEASDAHSTWTDEGKTLMRRASSEVFEVFAEMRKAESAAQAAK